MKDRGKLHAQIDLACEHIMNPGGGKSDIKLTQKNEVFDRRIMPSYLP